MKGKHISDVEHKTNEQWMTRQNLLHIADKKGDIWNYMVKGNWIIMLDIVQPKQRRKL